MDQRTGAYLPSTALHSSHYPYYPSHQPHPIGGVILPPQSMQQLHVPYYPPLLPFSSYTTSPHTPTQSSRDEVRTLFIAGLPEDVKPREIYNLFRSFPGYESSHLRASTNGSQPFAFVVFVDQASSVSAMQSLNGMVFDPEKGSTLHIDLAKANSRSKRSRADDVRMGSKDKKARGPGTTTSVSPENGVGSIHTTGMSNSAYKTSGYSTTQSHDGSPEVGLMNISKASNAFHGPQDNPPCPTLFVANLGPQCTEQELTLVFSRCSGFLKLKMQRQYGSSVAFIDFLDTNSSTAALNELQGTVLESALHGASMRLEYAKSRMGIRRSK